MSDNPKDVSTLLPRQARDALTAAAASDPALPRGVSPVRAQQLESAIERVKLSYPEYFHKEQ